MIFQVVSKGPMILPYQKSTKNNHINLINLINPGRIFHEPKNQDFWSCGGIVATWWKRRRPVRWYDEYDRCRPQQEEGVFPWKTRMEIWNDFRSSKWNLWSLWVWCFFWCFFDTFTFEERCWRLGQHKLTKIIFCPRRVFGLDCWLLLLRG